VGEYVQDVISGEYYMSIYGDKTEILCRKTKSIDVVRACQSFTGSEVPSCLVKRKT